MNLETMRRRAQLIQSTRRFFVERNYLEVDTPIIAPALIPESVIEPFETRFTNPFRDSRQLYLVPSPEIWMKRLLAAGSGNLFQIGHCFRNSEQVGSFHNPEFTMLEWYTVGADYMDSAELTAELLANLAGSDARPALQPPIRRMSMAEAFGEIAGIDLASCVDVDLLRGVAKRAALNVSPSEDWEVLFNRLFLLSVEPYLPRDRPLLLYAYPQQVATLAKAIPGTPWCERWELYLDGIEIANCFTEETDRRLVEGFYLHEETRLNARGSELRSDREFLEIFGNGFPDCSGVALGMDRLLMCLLGIPDIRGVIFPTYSDIFG